MKTTRIPNNIDEYIAEFPVHIQLKLEEIRETIRNAAPGAEEKISYQMPAFILKGNLVYFAAHTNHIGFYPHASGVDAFKNELGSFKIAKGSIKFPIDEPLPSDLIAKIVTFRLEENIQRYDLKAVKKK